MRQLQWLTGALGGPFPSLPLARGKGCEWGTETLPPLLLCLPQETEASGEGAVAGAQRLATLGNLSSPSQTAKPPSTAKDGGINSAD